MVELRALVELVGYAGVAVIVFAESGLLVGFFLPGDSLLFTAGFLASQEIFSLPTLAFLCFIAAVAGDSVGYAFGHRMGRKIFTKSDSLFFHRENLLRAERFYAKHGGKTIVLARFLPVVRTFAPILAGVGSMRYSRFLTYNVFGGFLWAVGLTLLGYFLGSVIPDVDRYLLPIVVSIIVLSVLPTAFHVLRHREDRRRIARSAWRFLQRASPRTSPDGSR
ncbi:MAG: putative membrane-associated protein [Parcubacteria group bacterium Gr01-1014_38]|nr:MAG: putative membrane-associated protein [Parcubacteria group bacterium Gr01-1014_38]